MKHILQWTCIIYILRVTSPYPYYYYCSQVLRRVQDDGVEQLVVVPLYPHYSVSTSGSSLKVRTIVVQCCI